MRGSLKRRCEIARSRFKILRRRILYLEEVPWMTARRHSCSKGKERGKVKKKVCMGSK